MTSLFDGIQPQIEQYILMICSIFDVDVDICDSNLIRIAGTGKNNRRIGKKPVADYLKRLWEKKVHHGQKSYR